MSTWLRVGRPMLACVGWFFESGYWLLAFGFSLIMLTNVIYLFRVGNDLPTIDDRRLKNLLQTIQSQEPKAKS